MFYGNAVKGVRRCCLAVCLLIAFGFLWAGSGLTARASDSGSGTGAAVVASGSCGLNGAPVTWTYRADGVLTVSGSGAIADYKLHPYETYGYLVDMPPYMRPWEKYTYDIREVVICDGVTAVGEAAFSNLYVLEKATVASSVKVLRKYAFANNEQMTQIDLGNGVESIGEGALYDTGLTTLTLPASLKQVENGALGGIWNLQSFHMDGNGALQVRDGAFFADGGRTLLNFPLSRTGSYHVPDGTTKIQDEAFFGTHLSAVTMADTVEAIGNRAFADSRTLQSIVFSKNVKTLVSELCSRDDALMSVTIPEGVVTLEGFSFDECTSLHSVTLPTTVTELGTDVFPQSTKIEFRDSGIQTLENGTYRKAALVSLCAKAEYKKAFEVLKLINKERKKAGRNELVMDEGLLKTAMLRTAETILYWDHTRPVGELCFTANAEMAGENCAWGQPTASAVVNSWMGSDGHRKNILNESFQSVGIGCIKYEGRYYWVQCFGKTVGKKTKASAWKDKKQTWKILVKADPSYYGAKFSLSKKKLKVGESAEVIVKWNNPRRGTIKLDKSGAIIESLNKSVCKISGGKIKAAGPGKAKIKIYFKGYPEKAVQKTITVTGKKPAKEKEKITVKKTAVAKLSSPSGKKLSVRLKKVSGAAGYEVICATNSSFTKNKKVFRITGTSKTVGGLKKGTTYYVKARAYKKDSAGRKVYGAYSGVKHIRTRAK